MVMRDESTLINRGPSPRPPVTFGRSPQPPAGRALEQGLDKQMDSLRNAVVEVIKGTEWPLESKEAAMGLIDTVESPPGIPQNMNVIPQDIQDIIKEYVQVLEDVYARLKDASSKSGIKNWKIFQTIRSMTSKRPSRCTLLFQTCQHDLAQAANDLRERMDSERSKGAFGPPEEQVQLTAPSAQQLGPPLSNTQSNTHGYAIVPPSPTPSTRNSLSHGFEDEESGGPIQGEVLNLARKTFKAVEIASGSIPVAGSFVAAAAKVGLAFVETIQAGFKTMDKNDSLAKDLGAQTAKLSKLLTNLMEQPNGDHGELIADHITDLHRELHYAHDKVTRWKSLGRFDKAFHSRDHAELLKAYQGTIQTALEELQLLVSLDTRNMTIELRNAEAQEQKRRLLDRLGDGKYGAQGNTIEDVVCFPGTRVEILKQIDNWIRDSSTSDRVLWIRGMAGRGKSTIASTVVHGWKCRASCAIFHFRRGQNKVNTRFVCALARQLGSSLVLEVKNAILDSVRENQDIANQRLEEQFKALIVAPFSKTNVQGHPILIVIDALDECDNLKDAVDFVRLLDRHSQSFPANVKFLVTCRPEAPLIRALEPKKWHVEDLDTASDVSDDLERFIRQAFKQIRDSDPKLPEDWPLSKDVLQLVKMSQGLFQWARTAITYIGDGSPVNRLRVLLKRPSMWSGLDDLYHQILSKAFESVKLDPSRRDLLCRVLGTVIVAPYPISLEVIASLFGKHEMFEGTSQEDIIQFLREDILADLNSLLCISSPAEPVHLMHTSIRDLLTSHDRCEQRTYYIDPIRYHQQLANLCLEIMLGGLKENVCNLFDISKPSSEVQDIMEREVSKAVRYSCRSWSIHLTEGTKLAEIGTDDATVNLANFETFSKEKLMCWLEVMSLVGATTEAIGMATRVYQWLLQRPSEALEHNSLAKLWSDVQRFISTFKEPISFGPLHVYASSLPHCPVKTELFGLFGKHAKVRTLRGFQSPNWPASLWERSIGSKVMTVVFSPDGRIVASGSNDGTIQLWEPQTGMAVGEPLTGHSDSVRSLCFSPNGKILASGSDDKTIRFWDPHTRAAVGEPLTAGNGSFNSVCFSPDGKLLASGSDDKIIRFWDPHTGAAVGEPLTGHSHSVSSLCFSPDGKLLASGSRDMTIRLWNIQTRAAVAKLLTSDTYWVTSVCFSPDGKILAVGSNDKTIQLWDPQTRTAASEALTGHSDFVKSVCFSPDGKILASGSFDGTIRFWDPLTRAAVGEPLTCYKKEVNSVCFSPDGKVLASGSNDEIIRLWDPHTRAAVDESLTAHDDSFNSVCFSPNGKILASGSDDGTIRLWDPHTGAAVSEPLTGHCDSVTSLCFSRDGKLLASGSRDDTIQLWNPQTGRAVGGPLTGHRDLVMSLCFSPDGKLLASGSRSGTIQLWNPQTERAVGEPLTAHSAWVRSVCFSPDGKILASGSDDRTIRLWNPQTGMALGEPLTAHSDWVRSVCFSPDGKILASGSDDRTIRLWDPQTGTAVGEPLTGHSGWVTSVSFSSDGPLLMARCKDGSSATWDISTYQRCNAPRTLLNDTRPGFQDHWVTLFFSPFFWLPPQYWGTARRRKIFLSGGTLVVLHNGALSIFDVSQALGLTR